MPNAVSGSLRAGQELSLGAGGGHAVLSSPGTDVHPHVPSGLRAARGNRFSRGLARPRAPAPSRPARGAQAQRLLLYIRAVPGRARSVVGRMSRYGRYGGDGGEPGESQSRAGASAAGRGMGEKVAGVVVLVPLRRGENVVAPSGGR